MCQGCGRVRLLRFRRSRGLLPCASELLKGSIRQLLGPPSRAGRCLYLKPQPKIVCERARTVPKGESTPGCRASAPAGYCCRAYVCLERALLASVLILTRVQVLHGLAAAALGQCGSAPKLPAGGESTSCCSPSRRAQQSSELCERCLQCGAVCLLFCRYRSWSS